MVTATSARSETHRERHRTSRRVGNVTSARLRFVTSRKRSFRRGTARASAVEAVSLWSSRGRPGSTAGLQKRGPTEDVFRSLPTDDGGSAPRRRPPISLHRAQSRLHRSPPKRLCHTLRHHAGVERHFHLGRAALRRHEKRARRCRRRRPAGDGQRGGGRVQAAEHTHGQEGLSELHQKVPQAGERVPRGAQRRSRGGFHGGYERVGAEDAQGVRRVRVLHGAVLRAGRVAGIVQVRGRRPLPDISVHQRRFAGGEILVAQEVAG
eukprot:ctg_2172.g361